MPTYADFTTSTGFGFGDAVQMTDTCCGGPVTVRLTLLVRDPEADPPCPSPPTPMAAVLRQVGQVSLTAAPAPPPGPPCRHRGDELPAGAVAPAGLSTLRRWHTCDKAGFERYGRPVSECRTCGVPDGQKCWTGCPGYEPGDPD